MSEGCRDTPFSVQIWTEKYPELYRGSNSIPSPLLRTLFPENRQTRCLSSLPPPALKAPRGDSFGLIPPLHGNSSEEYFSYLACAHTAIPLTQVLHIVKNRNEAVPRSFRAVRAPILRPSSVFCRICINFPSLLCPIFFLGAVVPSLLHNCMQLGASTKGCARSVRRMQL